MNKKEEKAVGLVIVQSLSKKEKIWLSIIGLLFILAMVVMYLYGQKHKPNIPIEQTIGYKICYPGFCVEGGGVDE